MIVYGCRYMSKNKKEVLKSKSPAALAEEYVIRSIWSKRFPAGMELPKESVLADLIGVTRTTLREVLQRLARDGWLTIQHGKPTRVNNVWETAGPNIIGTIIRLDKSYIPVIVSNVVSLRTRMAEAYIPQAVKKAPKKSAKLFKGLDKLENTAEAYAAFDYGLFREFTFLADKPVYGLILNSFKTLYHQVAKIFFNDEENRRITLNFYQSLLAACNAKDSEKAADCMVKNRKSSEKIWRKLSKNLPDNLNEL